MPKSKLPPVVANPPARTPAQVPLGTAAPAQKEAAHPLAAWRHELGKLPDEIVAEHAKSSRKTVGEYRRKLGIDAYTGHRAAGHRDSGASKALSGFIDMLGTTSDDVIAGIAGVASGVVTAERNRRGIPAFVEEAAATGAESPLARFRDRLGTVADAVIAAEAGVMRTTVGAFRRSLDIPAYEGHRTGRKASAPIVEEPKAKAPAAPVVVKAVAESRPPSKPVVEARPEPAPVEAAKPAAKKATGARPERESKSFRRGKLDAFAHLMGTMADSEIARRANSSVAGVEAHRARHNIKAWANTPRREEPRPAAVAAAPVIVAETAAPPVKGTPGRKSKLDAHRPIIGVLSDASVAARASVTAEAVRQYRKRHNIDAASRAGAAEAVAAPSVARVAAPLVEAVVRTAPTAVKAPAARVATPAAMPAAPVSVGHSHGTRAFRVDASNAQGTERFVIVAGDIGGAASAATAALAARAGGPWAIRSVRDIGESL